MVFDPAEYDPSRDRICREEAGFQEHYPTLQEAIKGHALAVEWLKERIYANRSVAPECRTRTL
jgi:hypothetical protein